MRYRLKRVSKWISLLGESARSQNRRVERELDPWKRARSATLIFIMRRYTVQHYSLGAQASLRQSIARLRVSPSRVCRQSWLRLRRRGCMVGRRGPFERTCPKGHRQQQCGWRHRLLPVRKPKRFCGADSQVGSTLRTVRALLYRKSLFPRWHLRCNELR